MLRPITTAATATHACRLSLRPDPDILFWIILCATVVLKFCALLSGAELTFDEAYYWHWSKNLDWCYFSKGPAVAAIIRVTTSLLGDNEVGVRFGSIVGSTGMILSLYYWSRDFLGCRRSALLTILLLLSAPLLAGMGVVMTIDSPLIVCWTFATVSTWYAIETGRLRWWIAVGLSIGAGILCKFTMLLFVPALLLAVGSTPDARRHFLRPGPYVAIGIAALSLAPILLWNVENGWITLRHTLDKASVVKQDPLITFKHLLPSLGTQLGVISPVIGVGLIFAAAMLVRDSLGWSSANALEVSHARFLLSIAAPAGLFYIGLAFHRVVEGNWMAAVFLPLLPAAAYYWIRPGTRVQRWSLAAAIVMGLVMQLPLFWGDFFYAARVPQLLEKMGIPFQPSWDLTNRVHGWRPMAERAVELGRELEAQTGQPTFYFTNHYSMAAFVGFYGKVPDRVIVATDGGIVNQFDYWGTQGRWPPQGVNAIQVRDTHKSYYTSKDDFQSADHRHSTAIAYRAGFPIRRYEFDVFHHLVRSNPWQARP